VLFLFVTSHGSDEPAYLSVDNNGLQLTQLTPARLKAALAATPIKWKSDCGVGLLFRQLHPCAARRQHVGDHRIARRPQLIRLRRPHSMTDFGRAYFSEALKQTMSFTAAFELARTRIAAREKAEGLTPSQPQMALGSAFADKWHGLYD